MIRITGLKWAPEAVWGLVRDLRLRWACREAGLAYEMRLVDQPTLKKSPDYRAQHPFRQVPLLEIDGRTIFESGAALLEIAGRSAALLPREAAARDRTLSWLFAAFSSVEPYLMNLAEVVFFMQDEDRKRQRRPEVIEALDRPLRDVEIALGDRDYLADRFTVADLALSTMFRIADRDDILDRFPKLAAFKARCEDRTAFKEALAEQLADFSRHSARDMRYREAAV